MCEHMLTYCPECDIDVDARLENHQGTLAVRGESVSFLELTVVCPRCGATIGDARVEGKNLERAYDSYRSLHGILPQEEIKALRQSYGLSLREFSKFLGFGEQTAYRYERGDIPDITHNNVLVSARSAHGARLLLSQNGSRLSKRSIERVEHRIEAMNEGINKETPYQLTVEELEASAPSAANGFRRLDLERVSAVVYVLASTCRDLYWTKLQKAMFFTDMICFERSSGSLTGLTYAHATHGPVMDRKDEIRFLLVERGIIDFRECGWGEVLVPLCAGSSCLSKRELSFIDEVAQFVNTFDTSTELSSFSHGLRCWQDTADGMTIEYTLNDGEVGRSMVARMNRLGLR